MGVETLNGFPYPPSPWLVYPYLGFATGRLAVRLKPRINSRPGSSLVTVALGSSVFGGLAFGLAAMGASVFRWGSMSATYFIATFAAVGFSLAASFALPHLKAATVLQRGLSLGGLASFAIVPLHYAALAGSAELLPTTSATAYTINIIVVIVSSFIGAAFVAAVATRLASFSKWVPTLWLLIGAVVSCGFYALANDLIPPSGQVLVRSGMQLLLCLLLALPFPLTAPAPKSPRGAGA
jgi:hypothetical protein